MPKNLTSMLFALLLLSTGILFAQSAPADHTAIFNVLDFGADNRCQQDATAAIQTALDAGNTYAHDHCAADAGGSPEVFFPAGCYKVGHTLNTTSQSLIGMGAQFGTILLWDGAQDGTMFTRTGTGIGCAGFNEIAGFEMGYASASAKPSHYLSFTQTPDWATRIHDLHFDPTHNNGSGPDAGAPIAFYAGWAAINLRNLRWDGPAGPAIYSAVVPGMAYSSWSLDTFYYDDVGVPDGGSIFLFDVSRVGQVSNASHVVIDGKARVEGSASLGAPNAFVYVYSNGSAGANNLSFDLSRTNFQIGSKMTLLYSDARGGFNPVAAIDLENGNNNFACVVCATGGVNYGFNGFRPITGRYFMGNPFGLYNSTLAMIGFDGRTIADSVRERSDTVNRRQETSDGASRYSDGSHAADTGTSHCAEGTYCIDGETEGDAKGSISLKSIHLTPTPFAGLGTPPSGTIEYCSDCVAATPCKENGTGAIAKRLNGVWSCN